MDHNIVNVEELKNLRELKEKMLKEQMQEGDYEKLLQFFPDVQKEEESQNQASEKQDAYQLTKTNPSIPSLLDKKAGFSNVIYLAVLSLVSEIVFLAISFLIYK